MKKIVFLVTFFFATSALSKSLTSGSSQFQGKTSMASSKHVSTYGLGTSGSKTVGLWGVNSSTAASYALLYGHYTSSCVKTAKISAFVKKYKHTQMSAYVWFILSYKNTTGTKEYSKQLTWSGNTTSSYLSLSYDASRYYGKYACIKKAYILLYAKPTKRGSSGTGTYRVNVNFR